MRKNRVKSDSGGGVAATRGLAIPGSGHRAVCARSTYALWAARPLDLHI